MGEGAVARLRRSFSAGLPDGGRIAYGVLRDPDAAADGADGEVFDEVLVVRVDAALGDGFELHTHGSPFVVAEIMARLAPEGEPPPETPDLASLPFRDRAAELVHRAPSGHGARILLDQAAGAMDQAFRSLRSIEIEGRPLELQRIAERGRGRLRLFHESSVALVGPVNAGKSTLFNVLVGAEAASVSGEAGTTRDALLERARIGPWPVRFLDTAGERDLDGLAMSGDQSAQVEQAGQRIARELALRADLVLRLVPFDGANRLGVVGEQEALLGTQAATALGSTPTDWPPFALSAKEAPEHARAVVRATFESALNVQRSGPLWSPGEAVPFDEGSIRMLEDASKRSEVDDRALDALLEQL
jgi:hypothetical protein